MAMGSQTSQNGSRWFAEDPEAFAN